MIPGLGGMNPKQMARMMEQMGIKTKEIDASEVIVKKKDGSELVVSNAQVMLVDAQGQKMLQVSGTISEREGGPSDDDVKLVMEASGASKAQALSALKEAKGDIAEAIMKLGEKK
ncbi:Nascent polypeptide-associated complex protein [uncultured archaeon]|nr:Nascent polypeptide-associated complex protein [uncultured archaeon]